MKNWTFGNTITEILGKNIVIRFIGNKEDLYMQEEVKEEEIEKYAEEKKALYKCTSTKKTLSFENFFQEQVEAYIKKTEGIVENAGGKKLNLKKDNKPNKWC